MPGTKRMMSFLPLLCVTLMPKPNFNQGDIYFCDPDPKLVDTVGSEQRGDHVWAIVSTPTHHRGNCVVGVPLSKHTEKVGGHLLKIPSAYINYGSGEEKLERVALTDQIRALNKTRLRRQVGTLSKMGISAVFQGLDSLFGRMVVTRAATPKLPEQANPQDKQFVVPAKLHPTQKPTAPKITPGTPSASAD
jgi:mRNA-degrading endonuclease toxin of MazEF toxin-antitoxin module